MDGCSISPRTRKMMNTAEATLSFKIYAQLEATHPNSQVLSDYPNFPDFENPRDANKDNVYEVTIVVTDSTLVNRDELNVTVKVINSTEDNRAGKVLISNRQPEGASSLLTATLVDADLPIKDLNWQWYRSTGPNGDADYRRWYLRYGNCRRCSTSRTSQCVYSSRPSRYGNCRCVCSRFRRPP